MSSNITKKYFNGCTEFFSYEIYPYYINRKITLILYINKIVEDFVNSSWTDFFSYLNNSFYVFFKKYFDNMRKEFDTFEFDSYLLRSNVSRVKLIDENKQIPKPRLAYLLIDSTNIEKYHDSKIFYMQYIIYNINELFSEQGFDIVKMGIKSNNSIYNLFTTKIIIKELYLWGTTKTKTDEGYKKFDKDKDFIKWFSQFTKNYNENLQLVENIKKLPDGLINKIFDFFCSKEIYFSNFYSLEKEIMKNHSSMSHFSSKYEKIEVYII